MKRYLILLLTILFLISSCSDRRDEPVNLNRECEYEVTTDYETQLDFDKPLFYKELEGLEYEGKAVDGFYALGESRGIYRSGSNESYNPHIGTTEALLVNDDINYLSTINIDDINENSVREVEIEDGYTISTENIHNTIMANIFYEYYEEYYEELNQFLVDNNVPSIWEYEELTCGRRTKLGYVVTPHPNVNSFFSVGYYREYNYTSVEHRQIISQAIQDKNVSVKTNSDLKEMIEDLQDFSKYDYPLEYKPPTIHVTIGVDVDMKSDEVPDFIKQYEEEYNSDFEEDLQEIIRQIWVQHNGEPARKSLVGEEEFIGSISYFIYKDGKEVDEITKELYYD